MGEDTKVLDGTVEVRLDGTLPEPPPKDLKFTAKVSYQACSDKQCLLPMELTLSYPPAAPAPSPAPGLEPPAAPLKDLSPAKKEDRLQKTLRESGLAGLLLLLFLGGLALNLTPCVFPMIPITVSFFGGQSSGSLVRSFGLAVAYVLGMAVTYSSMGVAAALLGGLLGAALNHPAVILLISGTFFALALSMFGLFELTPPAWIADRAGAREGFGGAFLMGLVVGFVAAPCVGPVSAALLLMVAEKGEIFFGFITFFALSLGLGFPYLILAVFSGMLRAMPGAGMWMDKVKYGFGVILLAMSVWYAAPLLPDSLKPGHGPKAGPEWTHDLAAIDKPGKPVMIDFYSDIWCAACKEMDHETWPDAAVIAESKRFVNVKVDVDDKGIKDKLGALTKRFGIQGIPTIVFLDSKGTEVGDARVSGFLPPADMIQRMRMAK